MLQNSLANYNQERTLFTEFIESDSEPNILLFHGASGSGKSHLIEHCVSQADMPSLLLKIQSGHDSIPSVFTQMGNRQGWANLPHFTHTVAGLVEKPADINDAVWYAGMHRHLREVGKLGDRKSRLSRYQLLTDAWFADATQFNRPFLLAVDTYENATDLFAEWFRNDFLSGAANSSRMRVVVSGQSLPEVRDNWGFCASVHELKGVHEAEAWLEWAEGTGYQVPSLEYLAGIVHALHGDPSEIIKIISSFPKRNPIIAAKDSIRTQRKQLRENLITYFNLPELKDICFDMDVDYELLPEHGEKRGFVRELLAYLGRVGRLHELIQVCQAERPHIEW